MDYEHPLDRFMQRSRRWFWGAALLALPVFLVSYLMMLRLAFEAWPLWGFAATGVAHVLAFIGFGSLVDSLRERRHSSGHH